MHPQNMHAQQQQLINGAWVVGNAEPFTKHDPVAGMLLWQGAAASSSQVGAAVACDNSVGEVDKVGVECAAVRRAAVIDGTLVEVEVVADDQAIVVRAELSRVEANAES